MLNYFLRFHKDIDAQAEMLAAMSQLFNEEIYPPGIPQWGEVEVTHLNNAAAKFGFSAIHGQVSNCSGTAAFPTNPEMLRVGK